MSRVAIKTPAIFAQFPEVVAGITLRAGTQPPYQDANFGFRALQAILSSDEHALIEASVIAARQELATSLLGPQGKPAITHQTHSDLVIEAPSEGDIWGSTEADAQVTTASHLLLCELVADCAGILLYDPEAKVIASVHSGWRGTKTNIIAKTILKMANRGADPARLHAYISPIACAKDYEVGPSFYELFDKKFMPTIDGRVCFDNRAAVTAQLRELGVTHIEADQGCTVEDNRFHSYRRDSQHSGRLAVFIGLRPR
ncbi:MAG TPA: peptidoglycan editing factor PgeF [Candidatus Saccharimonadales bacterium]|nr:peptidoglycan editing factor PgeF [Candidatus Saccharimonadales bacterium]